MSNPSVDVQQYGQSIWIDNIQRRLLEDGTFQRMIDAEGVVGVTSNPSIFQKAIGNTSDYDELISGLLDMDSEAIYERLAIQDIQAAADLFRPVYDRTNGRDGYVSLEVSPALAHDTTATIAEAKRLFRTVERPNVMIKIPATPEGIPAIEQSIADGINVNVTLIFSVENYMQVAEAYIRGLEKRHSAGDPVDHVASVASFFLSRIDTMVDNILDNNIHAAKMQGDVTRIQSNNKLLGQTAIANAKLAYKRFKEMFYGERFAALREAGATVQRPLWASTGTKNPTYPDTKYVDGLIGKDTVNTLPPDTLAAFIDHGTAERETMLDGIDDAEYLLGTLAEVGIDLNEVTNRLQADGVDAFMQSFDELIGQVETKRTMLDTHTPNRQRAALGIHAEAYEKTLKRLRDTSFNGRLWNHDGSIWKDGGPTINKIQNRLGWLDVRDTIDIEKVKAFQAGLKGAGWWYVVLLGMGGSSLAPEVLMDTFGNAEGFPALIVLDSTNPAQVKRVEDQIELDKTLFIVASKSGSTVETRSFYQYFYDKTGKNGEQFIAITDADTAMQAQAQQAGFRDIFINPSDIGGRYSALSYFGMVPAACIGIDIDRFWGAAVEMIEMCDEGVPEETNPGLTLGAAIAALGKAGRDKLTIFTSPSVASLGHWIEQLVAESIGKENQGIVPVVGDSIGRPGEYDSDRTFIYLKVNDDPANASIDAGVRTLREAGHPRITLLMDDKYAVAAEFFRWEYATAVIGKMYGINPFDEPNVTESKENTKQLLAHYVEHGALPQTQPFITGGNVNLFVGDNTLNSLRELCNSHGYNMKSRTELLAAQFAGTRPGDYFALLAYLPQSREIMEVLEQVRRRLRMATKRAVTVGYGPRYLHSTGQLHKGGSNNGVFVQITASHPLDLQIPGEPYTFGVLCDAQAAGDLEALQKRKRRVFRIHLTGDVVEGLGRMFNSINVAEDRRS
ncbi:MAG: bifunctional transaldolase/phosoglucose isomerase [Anaerolineaceae bacterium]|nr:MAG: bifunctional transaldolase/phosoglucose isomerase [Anaerolineaceae bacterium]